MAKTLRNFIQGRMNKSVDERLVPQGEYIDALNVRLGSTEGTEVGAVENSKGNELLIELEFLNLPLSIEARCIGAYEDGGNETIYWFIHDGANVNSSTGKVDMIVSFNTQDNILFYHVISTSLLNFSKDYLVNGINLINSKLLFFTDNLNPPRKINVNRNYLLPSIGTTIDQIIEQDIGVILAPPLNSPGLSQFTLGGGENYMEELLLSFAYRWQYEDGEYSALSPFTEIAFSPGPFRIDYQTYDNEAMTNSFNSVDINFETGGRNVKDIDVIFKFSTSQSVNVIERFNKLNEGWGDDDNKTLTFTNKKVFAALPEEQLLRLFDNVPKIAQAQTVMGNRLMYGNYVDGYDVVSDIGREIVLDYDLLLINETLTTREIQETSSAVDYSIGPALQVNNSKISVDFGGLELVEGSQIGFEFNYVNSEFGGDASYVDGTEPENSFEHTFLFNIQEDFASVHALAISDEFVAAISDFVTPADSSCFNIPNSGTETGSSVTDIYNCQIQKKNEWEYIGFGITTANQGFSIESSFGSDIISITIPALQFEKYDYTVPATPVPFVPAVYAYEYLKSFKATGLYSLDASKQSLHSNRDYEVAVVYMDEYGRSTTALVDTNNTVYIPCRDSVNKNNIRVQLKNYAPYWATKYKFVIKPSKDLYRTIYSNIFFQEEETGAVWFKLEGDNRDKIKDNDILYIKSDTNGALFNCATTKVMDFQSQPKDFLCEKDQTGTVISGTCGQPTGTYMKLKPAGFSANAPADAFQASKGGCTSQYASSSSGFLCEANAGIYIENVDTTGPTDEFIPYTIPAGSLVRINLTTRRRHRGSRCGSRSYKFDKTFVSNNTYNNLYDFIIGDHIDLTNGESPGDDATVNTVTFYEQIYESSPVYEDGPATGGNTAIFFRNDSSTGRMYLSIQTGTPPCRGFKVVNSYARVELEVTRATTLMVFETEPIEANDELYYENEQTFDIDSNGYHLSGTADADQNQDATQDAIIDTTFFNCYTFGNGVESDRVLDALTKPALVLGQKVTAVAEEKYKEVHRFSDITYSGVFNQETNLNKLNQFNLSLANFKTLESSFGPIRKLHSRQTDILVLQEDRISYVLTGKNLLSDAAAGGAITSIPEVLGTQITRIEEYGISNNPESFSSYGVDVFFTDAKRGSVINIKGVSAGGGGEQLLVISTAGMRSWFRDLFIDAFPTQKLGGYDPYMNEYVLSSNDKLVPQATIVRDCGYTLRKTDASSPFAFDLDCSTIIGDIDIVYTISGDVNLTIVWDGAEVINQDITGSGTVSFAKTSNYPVIAEVTVTPIGDTKSYFMEFKCPSAEELTVKQFVINFAGDVSLTTTTRYKWQIGTDISPYNSNSVVLESDGVSLYQSQTGPESFGTIPAEGSTVIMQSRQESGQTYIFDPLVDKFKYLLSNVNYNEVDINTLIPLLNTATPITGGPITYQSSFVYNNPSNDDYLYMVWDLREPTPITLCYSSTSTVDVCCDCAP